MTPRWRLFGKYAFFIIALVSAALLASGGVSLYFSYRENQEHLVTLQREKSLAAATRIEQYISDIEHQLGWTALPQVGTGANPIEQRRYEYLKLLRQAPAITEVVWIDASGREQLRVSRLAMDVVGAGTDFTKDPKFAGAKAGKTWYSPVYFRKETEPYMTISRPAGGAGGGITIAEVNLKFVWEVVSRIQIGSAGLAYVVNSEGALIAHPDISLVLQKTDLSKLTQVAAAGRGEGEGAPIARNLKGEEVLTAHAGIPTLNWTVFVELPLAEAFAPLYASILRIGLLLLAGLVLSMLASVYLARLMANPIRALQLGAARIGAGNLDQRIEVHTGDELEALSEHFNKMAGDLKAFYSGLERKVEERTAELKESLEQQTATADILRVISSSPTDIQPVLDAVAESAARLCDAKDVIIRRLDGDMLRLAAHIGSVPVSPGADPTISRTTFMGRAILERRTIHIHDVLEPHVREEYPDALFPQQPGHYRTALVAPLLRGDTAIGAIVIRRPEVRPFSDKQIKLLETFAAQAVIAIENVRLFTELEARTAELTRSVDELRALGEVGQAVSSSLDLETVLNTVIARAVEISAAHGGIIYEYDEAKQEFHLIRGSHRLDQELGEVIRAAPIRLGEGVAGKAAALRAPVQVPDVLDERTYDVARIRAVFERRGYRSLLAVPLLFEQRIIGVLVVWRQEPGSFALEVVNLLQTFATQSVLAIQNARLFREIDEKSRALEELSRNQEQLYRLSTALQEPLSLTEQLTRVLDAARQVVGLDRIYIWTLSPRADGLMITAQAGFEEHDWHDLAGVTIPIGEAGALAAVCREGAPLLFTEENPLPAEYRLRAPYSALAGLRVKSFLVIPMIARGRTVGVLAADNRASRAPIPPHTVDLLQSFAAQAAVAVENARLFQEIQEKSHQLELASKHKSQFLANMSHELRTPMNAVLGYTDLILDDIFGDVPAPIREILERVKTNGQHLLSLINDVLDLSKMEAGQLTLSLGDYAMGEVVHSVVSAVESLAAGKKLALKAIVPADLPPGRGDERRLTQVLLNLAGNAIKFTDTGQVSIQARAADGAFVVSVSDTGPGISEADQQKIFEEFQQADSSSTRRKGGSGLGLSISRRIVELHGGRLWVESALGEGSTFHFTVPLRVERQAERA